MKISQFGTKLLATLTPSRWRTRKSTLRSRSRAAKRRAFFESLEDRRLLATIVYGTSDPWLAGMPDGSTASCSPCSVAPAYSPALASGAVTGGQVYTFTASGSVDHGGGSSGPDGRPGVFYVHTGTPVNGIGSINVQINALLGVFLDNSQPTTTGVPPALNFSTAASMDFLSLSPTLKQPFFIGNGMTSSNAIQQFVAPAGATRLFLGAMDAYGYVGNSGSFSVNVTAVNLTTTTVSLSGTNLLIEDTDGADTADNLTLSINGSNLVVFDPVNRIATSILGATGNGTNTVTVPLSAFSGNVIANTFAGADVVNVGTLGSSLPVGLVVDGGAGFDTLNFNGTINLVSGANLTGSADTINLPNAASDVSTSGAGMVSLTADRNIAMSSGSSIVTVNGNLTLSANAAGTAGAVNTTGVYIAANSSISTTGTGNISLTGKGGTGNGAFLVGVGVSGNVSASGSGSITVNGTGGGDGTANSSYSQIGIFVANGGNIQVNDGNMDLVGIGGNGFNEFDNGVYLDYWSNASLLSGSGAISITATGQSDSYDFGTGANSGVTHTIGGPSATGPITIKANTAYLFQGGETVNIQTTGIVTIAPRTTRPINLGGADVVSATPVLGLTDAELDRITAGTINIGDTNSGAITVSSAITHLNTNAIKLTAGAGQNINLNASFTTAGGPLTLSNAVVVGAGVSLDTTNVNAVLAGAAISVASSINLQANTLTWNTGATNTSITTDISGVGGGLTKQGTGTLTLSGVNPYSGATTVSAGTLAVSGSFFDFVIQNSSFVTINAGATFLYSGNNNLVGNSVPFTVNGTLNMNGRDDVVGSIRGSGTIINNSANTFEGLSFAKLDSAYTFSGNITGNGRLGLRGEVASVGSLTLSGGTYALSRIDVGNGTLNLNGTVTTTSDVIVGSTQGFGLPTTGSAAVNVQGGTLSIGGLLRLGAASINGTYSQSTGTVSAAGIDMNTGTGGTGSGTVTLSGGTFVVGGSGVFATDNTGTKSLNIGLATVRASAPFTASIAATITSAPTIDTNGFNVAWSGAISGSGNLTKSGNGTLTVSAANTYTGTTSANAGTLSVTGSTAAGNAVTANSGGTLAGTGTINGTATIASGGTLSPGLSPGVLSTGILSVSGGYIVELAGNSGAGAANGHDQTNVTGTVTLGGASTLLLNFTGLTAGELSANPTFVFINNDGSDAVNGTFNGLAEGSLVASNVAGSGKSLVISYVGGNGNDVALLTVPPPSIASNSAGVSANEGSTASNTGTFSGGLGNNSVTITASIGTVTKNDTLGTWDWSLGTSDGPAGPIAVTINATDNFGATAFTTFNFTVNNVIPIITTLTVDNAVINENGSVTISGTFTDVGTQDTHTVMINWGGNEGSSAAVVTQGNGSGTFTATHQYLDDNPTASSSNPYTITATVTDDDGGVSVSSTVNITVGNVLPIITGLSVDSALINENGSVTISGSFTDLGTQDTHTVQINWGNGEVYSAALVVQSNGSGTFTATHQYLDDNPTNTLSDPYAITATVTDDDGGVSLSSTVGITVNNVIPVITSLSVDSAVINENGSVTISGSFTDAGTPDTHTVLINWGNGEVSSAALVVQGNGSGTFTATHQYLDDNPTYTLSDAYTITATVTDDDGGVSVSSTVGITVNNVIPVITGLSNSSPECSDAREGETITINAMFSDLGTLDTHTVIINWGDTTSSAGTVTESGGSGTLTGSHVYATGGIYTITVTLTDDDTGSHTLTTTSVITGVGVVGNTLYVIGTDRDDKVTINQAGSVYKVHADFLTTGNFRNVPVAGVTNIVVLVCDGDDQVTISGGISLSALIDGGNGSDQLNGGNGPNIILGGAGDDRINGGSNRDLLIGGTGADRLVGNSGDDLLIGGTTFYDTNYAVLNSIMAEWSSLRSYTQRVYNLSNGTGGGGLDSSTFVSRNNGGYFLIGDDGLSQTVFNDNDEDKLTGSSDLDWYFANLIADNGGLLDIVTDRALGELWTDTDFNAS